MDKSILIENSHKRSEIYGVEKEIVHSKKILKGDKLNKILHKNKDLIDISKIYINMVYSALRDRDFIIVLTDNEGCILHIDGNFKIVNEFEKINLVVGAYMDEKSIGTNAMGTALNEDKSVQITANEHYINIFQNLTCSAAPIHNSKGEIIGTLNLTGESSKKHPHTLGLVIFGVKAIENEIVKLKTDNILQETYNYMQSIIDNTDKGIMLIDKTGKIKNINELGSRILLRDKEEIINSNIDCIIPEVHKTLEDLNKEQSIITKEIKIKHTSNIKIIITFKGIRFKGENIGALITIIDEKEKENIKEQTGAFYTFEDLIGKSDAIKNVVTNCKIVANSPSTILIEGESGTGKEVLAQAMHNYSHRKNNKFVAINCGAIPKNIIESELFGYEEGTFTGGKKGGKKGKFELANGGTLFLDEIGEMPLDLQVNLLRVLQEGRVIRLGGNKEISIDVKVIAATNKDLKKEIKNGNFREDLYYRLCVIPIKLPSLRERKGDIDILLKYFLRIKAFKLNKEIPKISDELYKNLLNHTWPGNIRQLENCIENIVNLDGNISFNLFEEKHIPETKFDKNFTQSDILYELELNLAEVEKKTITKSINYYGYNISKAAKALGISRNTLYMKIKKYGIDIEKKCTIF